ncbi:MAG TPA: hypothetical protein VGQ15_05180 [Gaiellaceae bacterium]|jgi:hypothetical protein|nr:hypothetical protein [Gaiellaceae bacterium]
MTSARGQHLLDEEGLSAALVELTVDDVTISLHRGHDAVPWFYEEGPEGATLSHGASAVHGVAVGEQRVIGGFIPDDSTTVYVYADGGVVARATAPDAWLASVPRSATARVVARRGDGGVLEWEAPPMPEPPFDSETPPRRRFGRRRRGIADYR